MLPAAHRMRRSADFTSAVRDGSRARRGCVVVHHRVGRPGDRAPAGPALVGLVVGKSVGPSVVRHRVSRRLRARLAGLVGGFEPGSATVVRALPEAAGADFHELSRDLEAALRRVGVR